MKDLQGKVAFITGGASGIGLGISKGCAKYGMKVVMIDARQDALDTAIKWFIERNYPIHTIKLDVTDRIAYEKAADEAETVFGKIHVLVNNAGVAAGAGPMQNATWKDWDFMVSVNIDGVFNGIKIILPRIIKHGEGGHIVSTSSTGGLFGVGGSSLYCMSKFAVAGMMETLATDLASDPATANIGASVFSPGPTNSNLGFSSMQVRPEALKNEEQPEFKMPAPPKDGEDAPTMPPMTDFSKIFMTQEEVGERVVRGIRRGDLFILTHPEFKNGLIARNEALLRACPDEPYNTTRHEALKIFGTLTYNPIYETQTQVGLPDWE